MPRQVRNWILYTDLKYFHGTQVKSQKCKSSWCQFFRASARLRRFMPFKECYRFFGVFLGKKCSGANNYVFCVSEQLNIFKALNKKCKRMFLNEYFQTVQTTVSRKLLLLKSERLNIRLSERRLQTGRESPQASRQNGEKVKQILTFFFELFSLIDFSSSS